MIFTRSVIDFVDPYSIFLLIFFNQSLNFQFSTLELLTMHFLQLRFVSALLQSYHLTHCFYPLPLLQDSFFLIRFSLDFTIPSDHQLEAFIVFLDLLTLRLVAHLQHFIRYRFQSHFDSLEFYEALVLTGTDHKLCFR